MHAIRLGAIHRIQRLGAGLRQGGIGRGQGRLNGDVPQHPHGGVFQRENQPFSRRGPLTIGVGQGDLSVCDPTLQEVGTGSGESNAGRLHQGWWQSGQGLDRWPVGAPTQLLTTGLQRSGFIHRR